MFTVTKSRRVSIAVIVCAVFGALVGLEIWNRPGVDERFDQLMDRVQATDRASENLKKGLLRAATEDASTVDQYLQRCEHVDAALSAYAPALRKMDGELREVLQVAPEDKVRELELTRKVLALDLQMVETLRSEVKLAPQLRGMQLAEQKKFYNSEIVPLQEETTRLGKEQVKLVKDAKAAGVHLPGPLEHLAE